MLDGLWQQVAGTGAVRAFDIGQRTWGISESEYRDSGAGNCRRGGTGRHLFATEVAAMSHPFASHSRPQSPYTIYHFPFYNFTILHLQLPSGRTSSIRPEFVGVTMARHRTELNLIQN